MPNEAKHVLLISVDHMPGSLLGIRGRRDIMTPTLDSLAGSGILFENCYSTCPVCIPARRSLMTGMTPRSHGDRVYSDSMPMPPVETLAEAFGKGGYQTFAVGKLHVYPQRNRIGFHDAILQEEGRYEFGLTDDYEVWLGEQGYAGQEFLHGMGNNTYYTRPWHLPEYTHPTTWATREMMKVIKRRDPTRPSFYYISYQFPHPPLVPLKEYLDMYGEVLLEPPYCGSWVDESAIVRLFTEQARRYSDREKVLAKKAFFAQCTHIDHQIRLLIGTLRECNLLDHCIIGFLSDHGDMLFNHNMVAKRCFYEDSANVPLILSGKPLQKFSGRRETKLASLEDVMPTLLTACNLPVPESVEGINLLGDERHPLIYGEVGNGLKATRMVRTEQFKLIYYPCGNQLQLFDLEQDPKELTNLIHKPDYATVKNELVSELMDHMYGNDLDWIQNGRLTGVPEPDCSQRVDFTLYNQRGYHWPAPSQYNSIGRDA